ncbi:PrsW family glutamic-type intramembrane protease [Levilactobacillus lindianensis]|uniref:PrsW family glutamic-type intramembrane protease n=1 Tax=Levilactobacillus lindianensis TaxID=2486018 RepID=UPI000F73E52E|nr:PrsW family glutamic-type intramembrane protease [Levilactobacillus lindianensis]
MNSNFFCPNCGQPVRLGLNFCPYCGRDLRAYQPAPSAAPQAQAKAKVSSSPNLLDSATAQLNSWTGQRRKVPIQLGSMFSQVFKAHTEAEAETLFIGGTEKTTPSLATVSDSPVQPWLFTRVLAVFGLTIAILAGSLFIFNGEKMYNGLIFMSALAVPFSLLIMFFEINTFRNISIFKVTKIFMVGGVASVLTSMGLYQFVNIQNMTIVAAILVAIIEETGKLVIIAYYVKRTQAHFILNGLLIGAAIGAGFAAFETAGYAQDYGLWVLLLRAIDSLGTHTMWGAISGAALVMVKGDHPLAANTFQDGRFVRFFALAVSLHALWDMPLPLPSLLKSGILIAVAWVIVLVLINAGLREIRELREGKLT